ncbi:phenylalanine--tRNA ligase subunit alpha [Candidatus Woesearchaeota archaeon]|nr:phenylalanine--tRNA ligase subunit alpha [Candidatus Woesearchaeota archaeon]
MEAGEILANLHPLEKKALPNLADGITLSELAVKSGLQEVEAMRALQWLSNKGVLEIKDETTNLIALDENGKRYVKEGLPERRFLSAIKEKELPVEEIMKKGHIEREELNIALGTLKGKAAIMVMKKDNSLIIKITDNGKKLLEKESLEEQFLRNNFPIDAIRLKDEEKFAFEQLIRRKNIIKKQEIKTKRVKLTEVGKKLSKTKVETEDSIDRLTPQMLKSGSWKKKTFRKYDVGINVPALNAGKRHPYSDFLHQIREKLSELGFVEMTGPIIELEFWNFDALFQPQNHPARSWSDTYTIREPKYGKLPEKKIVDAVKGAHEQGGNTGSKGWRYEWNPKIAMQLMPRAHDTAISPRYLAREIDIPGKYYSLVRCYRPDVIDATHGVEFNQLGGFVVGEGLNFRHLLGILKEFAIEVTNVNDVKFLPVYYPFTEPSCQISVKHPTKGWMEIAGAGVFRPEMTEPLGIKEPVIAWGFGIDRLAMTKLGIEDIRDLFSQDIDYLRKSKEYIR